MKRCRLRRADGNSSSNNQNAHDTILPVIGVLLRQRQFNQTSKRARALCRQLWRVSQLSRKTQLQRTFRPPRFSRNDLAVFRILPDGSGIIVRAAKRLDLAFRRTRGPVRLAVGGGCFASFKANMGAGISRARRSPVRTLAAETNPFH